MDCIFCQIVSGEIPKQFYFSDEEFVVFADIAPKAPVHFLVVPKRHIPNLEDHESLDLPLLGRAQGVISKMINQLGIKSSYKIVVNGGNLQEVPHLHYHLLGNLKGGD